jgi:hypothetical protein
VVQFSGSTIAFLKAFQIASEIAKAKGKKAPDKKVSPDQDQGNTEAFLKAFQIASEIAKAGAGAGKDARRTELETIEEIERVLQQMKKKLQESRYGK